MLTELWQISHFGWITEAAVRRSVIIASGRDVTPALVADGLRQLLERGWVEQRPRGAGAQESEWRLTSSGRSAVPRR
jgi:DNA-binding HxlR family transcriptional regulator